MLNLMLIKLEQLLHKIKANRRTDTEGNGREPVSKFERGTY
jgi:hypothetical protein